VPKVSLDAIVTMTHLLPQKRFLPSWLPALGALCYILKCYFIFEILGQPPRFVKPWLHRLSAAREVTGICYGVYCSALARILTASASTPVLKKKDSTPWASVSRRIGRDVTCTSETWQVMPTTKEK